MNTESLRLLGIPDYLLNNDGARKMEDVLPQKLFSSQTLEKTANTNSPELFFALLPTTLLLESIFSEKMTRQQRIDNLLLGTALVSLYLLTLKYGTLKSDDSQSLERKDVNNRICFPSSWCKEYISATMSITGILATERDVHLGACGSHFIEHLFGAVRRLSAGEDTHKRFVSSMKNAFTERLLTKELGLVDTTPSRRSDSGNIMTEDCSIVACPLGEYFSNAKKFMNQFIVFPEEMNLSFIASQNEIMTIGEISQLIDLHPAETLKIISTKTMRITSTGGYSNTRRWKVCHQLENTLKLDQILI